MRTLSLASLFRETWQLLDPAQRRRFLWLQVLSLAMAFSTLLGLTAILPFLGVFADPALIARNEWLARAYAAFGFTRHQDFLVFLGVAFVVLVCIANAVNLAGQSGIRRFAHDVAAVMQARLFDEYLHRDLLFHARHDGAVLASRVIYPVDAFALGVLQNLLLLTTSAASCVLIFAAVLWVDPTAALLALVLFGGCYAGLFFSVRRRLLANGRAQAQRWNERARVLAESFGAIREILVSRRQAHFRDLLDRQSTEIARTAADTLTIAQLPRHFIECIAAAGVVGAAFWLGQLGQARWLAELTFLALAAYRLLPALQQGFAALAHIGADRAAFESISEDLRAASFPSPPAPRVRAPGGLPRREIRIEGVDFRYAPHLPLALRNVSMSIPAGARVALVGPNGSGKSTLADVIVGLLEPAGGAVFVDGERIDTRNRAAWQAGIAYVPQSVFLQNASVAENIAFGVPRDRIDLGRVLAVARQAQLAPFVDKLPGGFSELLGERGVRLSGGQRQLIGIARALYRDASLLVLDEATNALDADIEHRVIASLRDGPPRTTLVIAHHAAALRDCELVFELDAGAIVGMRPGSTRVLAEARP
jgi:ATP-binding cassette, subfamily B, bacterial PglK